LPGLNASYAAHFVEWYFTLPRAVFVQMGLSAGKAQTLNRNVGHCSP
jgi:hypothetical protein